MDAEPDEETTQLVERLVKDGMGPDEWLGEVLFGARYNIERHFGVSAETGMGYNRFRFRFGPSGAPVTPSGVQSTRGAERANTYY
jgi:hypothetical protein